MTNQVFLALRKTDAKGFASLFSKATRARIMTSYPHAGIVTNGTLYHITARYGMTAEKFKNSQDWDLFHVDAIDSEVLKRYNEHKAAKYDWLSLLGFVLPWRVSVSKWLYCYEWSYLAITGNLPKERITPEKLLTFSLGKYGSIKTG
jgi:hypothetical protein